MVNIIHDIFLYFSIKKAQKYICLLKYNVAYNICMQWVTDVVL